MLVSKTNQIYSYADYLLWDDSERWELFDGVPYLQTAPSRLHQDKLDDLGCKGAPDLIIEILSPSSGKQDKLIKFNRYESSGVKEYWIVEPEQKLVSVFVLQENQRYGRPEIYAEEEQIEVTIFKDLFIDLKPVFDRLYQKLLNQRQTHHILYN
ncbi:MAG: Uma2 family endonuclease [Vallitaleaceae bacterium]|nr:Uma2 family endonuclease [Vallitaleaceae bacterium]